MACFVNQTNTAYVFEQCQQDVILMGRVDGPSRKWELLPPTPVNWPN